MTCIPTQMPSTGRPPGQPAVDEPEGIHGPQLVHDGAEGPHAGHHESVGGLDGGPVGGQLDVGAHSFQGAHSRADVAAAVGQDDHAGLTHAHSLPVKAHHKVPVSEIGPRGAAPAAVGRRLH